MGIGDCGVGSGGEALRVVVAPNPLNSPTPHPLPTHTTAHYPMTPIPNPQSPIIYYNNLLTIIKL